MQQTITPAHQRINTFINIPGAKRITERAILLAALADGVSEISGLYLDDETSTLLSALNQAGIVTQLETKSQACIIAGGNGKLPKKQAALWGGSYASIVYYMLSMAAATAGVYQFDAVPDIKACALEKLIILLRLQGAQFIPGDATRLPLTLLGADSLEGNEIIIPDDLPPSMITALLFMSPFARNAAQFILTPVQHESMELDISMMAEFGVMVHRIHQEQFVVPVPQRYLAHDYVVEADFRLAATFFAAAALTQGEITIPHTYKENSIQQGHLFLTLLERMGCSLEKTPLGLKIKGPETLRGIEVSLRDCGEYYLTLIALAAFATTVTRISDIDTNQPKVAERVAKISLELAKVGVKLITGPNWLEIYPSKLQGNTVCTHQDAEIGMALALIGLKVPNIIIDQCEAVTALFPKFFKLWDKFGESVKVNV